MITRTKSIFTQHGILETVISDNGPQYASDLFARDYQFKHITSRPYFSQSNGEEERAVQKVKNLLRKSDDPYLAQHLCWQDIAPWNCSWVEYSEAQYQLFELRELHKFLTRTWFKTKDHVDKARQKRNFDSHHGARTLPSLMPGDIVWLPDRQTEGVVKTK